MCARVCVPYAAMSACKDAGWVHIEDPATGLPTGRYAATSAAVNTASGAMPTVMQRTHNITRGAGNVVPFRRLLLNGLN